MKHSKISTTLALCALLLFITTACRSGDGPSEPPGSDGSADIFSEEPNEDVEPVFSGEEGEIVLYILPDQIDPELYGRFQEDFEVEVTEDNFEDAADLIVSLRAQGSNESYALIAPSNYAAALLIEAGMLAEIDQSNIPNLRNLDGRFRNLPYDPGNKYCVPFQWGTTGVLYNPDVVQEPTSWSVFFNPDPGSLQFGRLTVLDDAREAFAAALLYLGYSVNSTDPSQIEEAKQLLLAARPGLAGFNSQTYSILVAEGENVIAHGRNDQFGVALERNPNLLYTIPLEGGIIRVDNFCIPATASDGKKAAAERFINFLLQPDIARQQAEYNARATPNVSAEALLAEAFLNNPAIYPSAGALDTLQFIEPVGATESVYLESWEEVKSAP